MAELVGNMLDAGAFVSQVLRDKLSVSHKLVKGELLREGRGSGRIKAGRTGHFQLHPEPQWSSEMFQQTEFYCQEGRKR